VQNRFDNAVEIVEHFRVPDPQHVIALGFEPCRAPRVECLLLGLAMLAAVDFDDETPAQADEIADVWTQRMLAAKAMARQLPLAQFAPEFGSLSVMSFRSCRARSLAMV
jgi:hypothetical protein